MTSGQGRTLSRSPAEEDSGSKSFEKITTELVVIWMEGVSGKMKLMSPEGETGRRTVTNSNGGYSRENGWPGTEMHGFSFDHSGM